MCILALVIAATGMWLRFWRLDWGLPQGLWFPDETILFTPRAVAFTRLSWASFDTRGLVYPTLYGNVSGLVLWAVRAVGLIDQQITAASPGVLLLMRAVSATMGVATIALVGITGARMYSPRVGMAAAALTSVVPFHAMHSHIAATDVVLTACTALTLLCAFSLARDNGNGGHALLAGVAAGLTFASKYTGLAMLVPVAWAILERLRQAWNRDRKSVVALGAMLGLASLLGFAAAFTVGCPGCVLHPHEMLSAMAHHRALSSTFALGFANNCLVPSLGWYGHPYLYQLVASLPYVLGIPLFLLAIAGLYVAVKQRTLADRLILSAVVPYFVAIGGWRVVFPRYLLPLVPGLVILGARSGVAQPRARSGAILVLAVWLYSLCLTTSQVRRFSFGQQLAVARWITQNGGAQLSRVAVPQILTTIASKVRSNARV
jgi:4-amino-4-deoxy-L-arabinose transferase-like glycosyltransferase